MLGFVMVGIENVKTRHCEKPKGDEAIHILHVATLEAWIASLRSQ